MNELCVKLAEILDVDEVKETDVLADFPAWDSLSVLSTIAMLGSNYGVNLTANDFKGIRTAGELWDMVKSRKQA